MAVLQESCYFYTIIDLVEVAKRHKSVDATHENKAKIERMDEIMKRKFLEDLGLEKEAIDKILDENSADIGKAKGEVGVLEDKVKNLDAELTATKAQVKERDGQLETLKKSSGDVEAMKAEITKLQGENKSKDEAHAKEIKTLKIESAVNAALTSAKALNAKAVRALLDLDMDKVEFDDAGSIKGLAEKIKTLQGADDSKFLFGETKQKMKGAEPGEPGKEDPDTKVDTSKMTYTELAAYMAANPDVKVD